jgi:NAD(P)-dependent dehydrogenase (short-subunit alcohol dehydrogenase family)
VAGLLTGKVALVTGSTQGLGAAIARTFHREGARVMLTGLERDQGERLAAQLGKEKSDALPPASGPTARFEHADLARVEDCRRLAASALEHFGGVDLLVNSAALTARSTLEDFTPELFDAQFHINLRAPLLLAQSLLQSLRERGGCIFNIGSINTEGERAVMTKLGHDPGFLDRAGKTFPSGRLIKPAEVAEVALLLASKKADAFSGAVIELEQFPIGGLHDPAADKDPTA